MLGKSNTILLLGIYWKNKWGQKEFAFPYEILSIIFLRIRIYPRKL